MDSQQFEALKGKLQSYKQATGSAFKIPSSAAPANKPVTPTDTGAFSLSKLPDYTGEILKGIGKGALSSLQGATDLVGKVLPSKETQLGESINKELAKPKTGLESLGFGAEQLGEFFIPLGAEGDIIKAAGKYGKVVQVAAKSLVEAADFSARTAIQTHLDSGQTGVSAVIGAVSPVLGAFGTKIAPMFGNIASEVLAKMSGKDAEAVKIAFKNPVEVAKKITSGVMPKDVRDKAVTALNDFRSKYLDTFSKGLENIKSGETSSKLVSGLKNTFKDPVSAARNAIGNVIQSTAKGIPSAFKNFAVGVSKNGKLDFSNSAIVKAGEQKNLQAVYDTIKNQTDFSPQGVQRTASRLSALSSFVEGAKTESSAIISKIHSIYANAISKTYPELGKLRSDYAAAQKIYNEIDSVINSKGNLPTKAATATKRLMSLFQDNNEEYLNAIKKLEEVSGVDLMKDLAASQFHDISPKSFGSKLGEVALLAGGIFSNPLDLLIIPLFSPKAQGKIVTGVAKNLPTVESAAGAIPKILGQSSRGIFGSNNQTQ